MTEQTDRIVILKENVKGDLHRCKKCGINFTAIQPCIVCSLIEEKENELGRKLNKEESNKLMKDFFG